MAMATNPPWLPWATFVAIIILSVASTSLQKEEEQQEEESQSPPLSPESFPWEPNINTSLSDTSLPSSSSPPQEGTNQTSNTREEEQLQFLACMTFANGGLRSPSCPCCQ
eukprot:scaffold6699_cov80-Skeletonema_menzelii.AAC.3